MLFETLMAGFGGQGILFMGDVLSEAALREGLSVTFLPTYGVAMRGGTANCVVTIADDEIGSPLLDEPHGAVLMNEPSMKAFQRLVRPGGIVVANSSLVSVETYARGDEVRIVWIAATEIAREVAGTDRAANMVALGAFLNAERVVSVESIETIIREVAFASKPKLIPKNIDALHAGMERSV